jgi:hypothetical protein
VRLQKPAYAVRCETVIIDFRPMCRTLICGLNIKEFEEIPLTSNNGLADGHDGGKACTRESLVRVTHSPNTEIYSSLQRFLAFWRLVARAF